MLMLILFVGTVVSKDLYHIILPHTATDHSSEQILFDADALFAPADKQSDCFLCKFEFSASQDQLTCSIPEKHFLYHEIVKAAGRSEFISESVLSTSLRGPPEVI